MLFNSYIFILLFLPICWAGYWQLIKMGKFSFALSFLTLCSMVFYTYWNPPFLLLLLGSVTFNYVMVGLAIDTQKKFFVYTAVIANLALLGYFKYTNFFLDMSNEFFGTDLKLLNIFLPLGISFFTFHQITYLFDSFNKVIPRTNFRDYALYIFFFPQLIAGPVVRARQFIPQINNFKGERYFWRNTAVGLSLFTMGLAKKVMIADYFADNANYVFNLPLDEMHVTFIDSWASALSYTFQLYFDFSGYSDMALGLALLFGFKLPINFFSPYKSQNIAEFWRRWHMTMSFFFRDYLYIPLGGSRCSEFRHVFNLILTMAIVGLWHGAGWTFILWGVLHGLYLAVHRLYKWVVGDVPQNRFYKSASWVLTFVCVVIGWTIFRAENLDQAGLMLKSMAGLNGIVLPNMLSGLPLDGNGLIGYVGQGEKLQMMSKNIFGFLFVAGIACLTLPSSMSYFRICTRKDSGFSFKFKADIKTSVFFAALLIVSLLMLNKVSEFLYFQF